MPIKFSNNTLYANLIEIDMADFDVILDIDWLTTHKAVIDCRRKGVHFSPSGAKPYEFINTSYGQAILIISAL